MASSDVVTCSRVDGTPRFVKCKNDIPSRVDWDSVASSWDGHYLPCWPICRLESRKLTRTKRSGVNCGRCLEWLSAKPRGSQTGRDTVESYRKEFLPEVKDGATGVCRLKEVSCLQVTKQQVSWTMFWGQESPLWKICEKQSHKASCCVCNQLLHQQKFSHPPSPVRSHVAACFLKACWAHVRFTHVKWFLIRAEELSYRDHSLRSLYPPTQKIVIRRRK